MSDSSRGVATLAVAPRSGENPDYLIYGQVAEKVNACLAAGREPDVEALVAQHPELAAPIREMVAALVMLHQLGQSPEAGQSTESVGMSELPLAGQLGDYRLLRELGRGGMGVVYEAEQISLGRHVALKVLPFAAALDAKQLQRFKNEAHAAAQLHHTNIVPVFGVGAERGVYYYAMQYIEGQTLAALIDERRRQEGLETGERRSPAEPAAELAQELVSGRWAPARRSTADPEATGPYSTSSQHAAPSTQHSAAAALSTECSARSPAFFRTAAHLGEQAAKALDHAHQLGVVHRDIKPANLLVDVRGNLWITDFGLAQVQGDTKLTLTGDLVGTLRYMSPEQALAQRVLVDQRTDIYSLGVTLYELLTLEPAFNGRDRQELLRQIAFEEPRPPRRLNKALPAELETIILTAIAKNPAERYATAQELADDLERFMRDEPIRAKRPTLFQRSKRWARRHKPVVWSAGVSLAVLLVMAVVALAVSNWLVTREKEQKTAALQRAETSYRLAHNALEQCMQLKKDPRLQSGDLEDLRRTLTQAEATFYQHFLELHGDEPDFQAERGRAFLKLGQVTDELGSRAEALGHFEQAQAISKVLTRDYPTVPRYQFDLARSHQFLGNSYLAAGRTTEAEEQYQAAIALFDMLVHTSPDIPECRTNMAGCQINLGMLRWKTDRLADAEAAYQAGLAHLQSMASDHPEEADRQAQLASGFNNLYRLYLTMGRMQEAEQILQRALGIRKALVRDHPQVPEYQIQLAQSYNNQSVLYHVTSRNEEAKRALLDALAIKQALADSHPLVQSYQVSLADSYHNQAVFYSQTGEWSKAEQAYGDSIVRQQALIRLNPQIPDYQADLAKSYSARGLLLSNLGALERAEPDLKQALTIARALVQQHPKVSAYQQTLATVHNNLGNHYESSHRAAEAEQAYKDTLAVFKTLVRDQPEVSEYRVNLGGAQCNLGNVVSDQGRNAEALDWYAQAAATLESLLDKEPRHATARQFLHNVHTGRASTFTDLARHVEALQELDKALALVNQQLRPKTRLQRAATLAHLKEYTRATAEARELAEAKDASGDNLYWAAGVYALSAAAARAEAALAEGYARRAIDLLRQAAKKNCKLLAGLKKDRDFDSLRGRDDFKKLLAELELKK